MISKVTAVDLFSGCGGMSLGFEEAGIQVLAGFENWKPALRVYGANFAHPAIEQDLSEVEESVEKILAFRPQMIVGGPPCQDFSTAGHQDESRGRAALSVRYSEIVCKVKPRYFVMENVATIRNTESFRQVLRNFSDAGYGITQKILNAAYCGVPQSRKRMFVVGALGAQEGFLTEELERDLADRPLSIRNYLGNTLGIDHYFRVPTNYNRRAVFSVDEPSTTIRAVDRPIPSGYKGHPNDSAPVSTVRGLTPKERSYIQTFPKDFKFSGGKSDVNGMIGNAVPVKLANFVASAFLRYIDAIEGGVSRCES